MSSVPADAAFLNITDRYYVRRCNDMDPEESLQDGTKGPASFARATGEREINPGSRTNCGSRRGSSCLTLNLERVALYLLRPDAGLVVPAPTPTPTWLGDAQRAGLVS